MNTTYNEFAQTVAVMPVVLKRLRPFRFGGWCQSAVVTFPPFEHGPHVPDALGRIAWTERSGNKVLDEIEVLMKLMTTSHSPHGIDLEYDVWKYHPSPAFRQGNCVDDVRRKPTSIVRIGQMCYENFFFVG
jgi:hypothetical protein